MTAPSSEPRRGVLARVCRGVGFVAELAEALAVILIVATVIGLIAAFAAAFALDDVDRAETIGYAVGGFVFVAFSLFGLVNAIRGKVPFGGEDDADSGA